MRVPSLLQLLASRVKCRPVPPMLTSSELHTGKAADKVRCQHHACRAHGSSCGQPERRSRKRAAESPAAADRPRPSRDGDPEHPPGIALSQPPSAPCGREQQLYGDTRVSGVGYLYLSCGTQCPPVYINHLDRSIHISHATRFLLLCRPSQLPPGQSADQPVLRAPPAHPWPPSQQPLHVREPAAHAVPPARRPAHRARG